MMSFTLARLVSHWRCSIRPSRGSANLKKPLRNF